MDPRDFDDLDSEITDLERELEKELQDLPDGDREHLQRAPHLAYVVLYTSDVEELAAFYGAVFGFQPRYESSTTVELLAGNLILAISDETQLLDEVDLPHLPRSHEGRQSNSFLVESVEQCVEAALAMGAQMVRPLHDTEWGMLSCWLRDPAGHLLEIGRFVR